MTSRQYLDTDITMLENLVKDNQHSRAILGEIHDELTYRRTERAKQLRKEVHALLTSQVKRPPRPRRPDSPGDQLEILEDPAVDSDKDQ